MSKYDEFAEYIANVLAFGWCMLIGFAFTMLLLALILKLIGL